VQPRIPRQSPRRPAAHGTDDIPGLAAEAATALAAARRRAVLDGDRQVDTAHLLHSLLEHDPRVRAAFGGGPQLARLLGYLVQRSIGYGLRWQSGVEDSVALPAVTTVEDLGPQPRVTAVESPGRTSGTAGAADGSLPDAGVTGVGATPVVTAVEGVSPLAAALLEQVCGRAARRAGAAARGLDLLAAIVAEPSARAVEVLAHAGVDVHELRARIEDPSEKGEGEVCLGGGGPVH
jgi:hypothetical protein